MNLFELLNPLLSETHKYVNSFETAPMEDEPWWAMNACNQWTSKIISDSMANVAQASTDPLLRLEAYQYLFDYEIMVREYLIKDKTALN